MARANNVRPRVAVVFGTRPEAIKLVPVIRELQRRSRTLKTLVISTGQHRQMLDQVIRPFHVRVDHDMSLMEPEQTLCRLSSNALLAFDDVLRRFRPDLLLVQGDTTTAFVASLAAYYAKVPVGHVEAGLRTNNKHFPFPEEVNRRLISVTADLHFAPTQSNRKNLIREGVAEPSIFVTGNTAIDMLLATLNLQRTVKRKAWAPPQKRLVLVTLHRREVFGESIREMFYALRDLAEAVPGAHILFPVHLNPNVRAPAKKILGKIRNVTLAEPLEYVEFVDAMSKAELILTDSGGIQEEAPTLGVPVLVLRNQTERMEGLKTGTAQLVGTDRGAIVKAALRILNARPQKRRKNKNPYGDGKASQRIVKQVLKFLRLPQGRYNGTGEFRP